MITLEAILDKGYLRKIHEDIRQSIRGNHLPQALLIKDPTLLSDFQYENDDAVSILKDAIRRGGYKPQKPTLIMAAKSTGLRRPLTFLRHDDALILSAMAKAARNGVNQGMKPWVSFGRADDDAEKRKDKKPKLPAVIIHGTTITINLSILEPDSGNWFFEWMKYRGLLKMLVDDPDEFIVVSDVANFFPTVDLAILRNSFSSNEFFDADATNLLFFMLDELVTRHRYAPRSPLGLPQDPYDASRTLAHLYLKPLDEELEVEGAANRYTRWVDDIAVSVSGHLEGTKVIARIQDALDRVGLTPNTVKTRIVSKQAFREEHLEKENGRLDVAHSRTDAGTVTPSFKRAFDTWLRDFLPTERKGYWLRVLRRFYTESRRIGNRRLASLAAEHLVDYPTEAAYILDYLSYSPATYNNKAVGRILRFLEREGQSYDDIQILIYEWLLLAPFEDDVLVRNQVVNTILKHLKGVSPFRRCSSYVAGLIGLVLLKFGDLHAIEVLLKIVKTDPDIYADNFVGLFYVFASDSKFLEDARAIQDRIRDPSVARLDRFLHAIESADAKATGIALNFVGVVPTNLPSRALVRARALPLLYFMRGLPVPPPKLKSIVASTKVKLDKMDQHLLRDAVLERHI